MKNTIDKSISTTALNNRMHVSIKPHLKSNYLPKTSKDFNAILSHAKNRSSPEGKVFNYFLNEKTNETYNRFLNFNHRVTRSCT